MKKIISIILVGFMIAALFSACGSNSGTKSFDAAALTDTLLKSNAFSGGMSELSESKAPIVFGYDGSKQEKAVFYSSDNGTNKERIVIVTAVSDDAAVEILKAFQSKVDEWIESDKNYAPDEVPKLEKAVLRQSGKTVLLVIANNPDIATDLVSKAL